MKTVMKMLSKYKTKDIQNPLKNSVHHSVDPGWSDDTLPGKY